MAARVRALPRRTDSPLVAVLKKLGCLYCADCHGYAWPEHRQHVSIFDAHTRETFPAAPVTLAGGLEEVTA